MRKLVFALLLLFCIGCVMAVDYSGYDYEDYVYVSDIQTNGSVQTIPIYLVSSYDNYDFDKDGDIDADDKTYAQTHGYILYPPSKITKPEDVNFDDGQYQIPAECVYLNTSKQVYAEYLVYTDKSAFYVRLHALYPHPLLEYTGAETNDAITLPYWIEYSGSRYYIWTKVNISANSNITLYIKNVSGYQPNGSQVFEFFDDFEGNALDSNKWTSSGSITVSDSILAVGDESYVYANFKLPQKLIIEAYIIATSHTNYAGLGVFSNYNNVKPHFYQNGYGFGIYEYSEPNWRYDSADSSGNRHYLGKDYKEPLKITMKYDGTTAYWISELGDWSQTLNLDITNYKLKMASGDSSGSSYIKVDYIFVRTYAKQEPTVSVEQISNDIWKVTISNPNDYDLTDFQVKILGDGIVSSKTDSLQISTVKLIDESMTMSDVMKNTHTFTISGNPGAIVGEEYIVSFDSEASRIIEWGDGTQTSTSSTTATHVYESIGTYTILATQYDTPWNIHRSLTVLVSSNVVNVTTYFFYEDGTPINDTNITLIYALGQNVTNTSAINVTTLANTLMTAKINDIVRQIWVKIGDTNISFYFPRKTDYIVQEIVKSYNPNDYIQIYLRDKLITEGYGEVNTYLTLGNVYKIYVNGVYYQDLIVDNSPDTIIVKIIPTLEKIFISESPTAYEIYAKSSEAKFLTAKVYADGTLMENVSVISSPGGATTYIWKTTVDSWFADENATTYHVIAIEVYDGPTLVAWNKFLFVHYSAPPKTQTMAWMVLVLGLIVVACVFILPRSYAWATMLLGAATIYVLGNMSIFNLDFNMFKVAGLLMGLGVVLYILTNIKR